MRIPRKLSTTQAQQNSEIKLLQRQNEELEGKLKLQKEKLNAWEAILKETEGKLKLYEVRFSHKLEHIKDTLSFSESWEIWKWP